MFVSTLPILQTPESLKFQERQRNPEPLLERWREHAKMAYNPRMSSGALAKLYDKSQAYVLSLIKLLVDRGDVERIKNDGSTYYRLTEQGLNPEPSN